MLTKTSLTAVQSLMYLAQRADSGPIPPTEIAGNLGCSSSYLAKIHTQLSKAGILDSHRGAKGGITLARGAGRISLREVMEACQGKIVGYACSENVNFDGVCGYHKAMKDLETAVTLSLERWSLADICARPGPSEPLSEGAVCKMACARRASPSPDVSSEPEGRTESQIPAVNDRLSVT